MRGEQARAHLDQRVQDAFGKAVLHRGVDGVGQVLLHRVHEGIDHTVGQLLGRQGVGLGGVEHREDGVVCARC